MAENPLSIRVSDDVKILFNELAEVGEFENKGEFLNRLLLLYQTEKTKDNENMLKPAIEAVETLTQKLLTILNGTAEVIATNDDKYNQALEEQHKSFEDTRTLLQQRITSLEREKAEHQERIQSFIEDIDQAEHGAAKLRTRIQELEQSIQDNQLLISEYREKLDTLATIANEYKDSHNQIQKLKNENNDLKEQIKELEKQANTLGEEVNKQAKQHNIDISNLKNTLNIEHEKYILELERLHHEKLKEEQLTYIKKIEEYDTKLFNLMNEKATHQSTNELSSSNIQNQLTAISPTEIEEILTLKSKGMKNVEIAKKTGVSTASVSRYVNKNKERIEELKNQSKPE